MKHTFKKSAALLLGTTLLTMAFQCGNDDEPLVGGIAQTTCGEHFDTTVVTSLGDEEQYIVERDESLVRVTHINWAVPCDLHDVDVQVQVEGTTVIVNEGGGSDQVDCICHIDNTFYITNLTPGTYTFIFMESGQEMHRQEYTI